MSAKVKLSPTRYPVFGDGLVQQVDLGLSLRSRLSTQEIHMDSVTLNSQKGLDWTHRLPEIAGAAGSAPAS